MKLENYLNEKFGYSEFKPGQKEVIEGLLQGQDTFAVLPTGTGKSLCYQLTGELLTGQVIIVSPLLSLMEDQVRQLQKKGIREVIAVNSSLSFLEKRYVLEHLTAYKFLFFSPEMLLQEEVLQRLAQLTIALFVVDEAHCVYQWGVDFRPEYGKLGHVQTKLNNPLTLALTATATPVVQKEIKKQLFNSRTLLNEVIFSVNRENIGLVVTQTQDKAESLLQELSRFTSQVIIYCATRKTTESINRLIKENTALKTGYYHGGLTPNERSLLQQQFINNQLDVLCATNAFGMGIDKPDVRVVIHFDLPDSLENYLQEIGRAGRDGQPSLAILLYKAGDEYIHRFFQEETKADRETLKFLVNQEEEQVTELMERTTEIQQKWLKGYLDQEYSFDELEERLINKEVDRQQQLQVMLEYVHLTDCRRQFIQSYFSEPLTPQSKEKCCDCCGLSFDNFQEPIVKSSEVAKNNENWRTILLRLFKEQE